MSSEDKLVTTFTGSSIFNPQSEEINKYLAGPDMTVKFSQQIAKDAETPFDINAALGITSNLYNAGLSETGITTEVMQEHYASLARGDYKKYAEEKAKALQLVRVQVVRHWAQIYQQYRYVGYPDMQARHKANLAIEPYKKSQMEIFKTMFPDAGKKVQQVY